jgi:signal peptidase
MESFGKSWKGFFSMKRLMYSGNSMSPTLKVPDTIVITPFNCHRIRVGDVIVFTAPDDGRTIVHRVVRIQPERMITRGDNNSANDPYNIEPKQVIGQVVCAWRGRRKRIIRGGFAGQMQALLIRAIRKLDKTASLLLRPIYVCFAEFGITRRIFSLNSRVRIIQIQRPYGVELQLFIYDLRIGTLSPPAKRWNIRRPFRLFIAEDQLPTLEEHQGHHQP